MKIGNNTFDHNFIFDENHLRGAFFYFGKNGKVVLADFGQGVQKSLFLVYKKETDLEALQLAFLEHVISRDKENRGNGLKFVSDNVISNKWNFFFSIWNWMLSYR